MSVGILIVVFVVLLLCGIFCICTDNKKKGFVLVVVALIILSRVCKILV